MMTSKNGDVFKDESFTGGFVPRRLADQLGLMAVFHNTTRSALLRNLLEENLMGGNTVVSAIKSIGKRLYKRWLANGEPLNAFKEGVVVKLKRKKLSDQFIKDILEEVDRCYAKDQNE
jgi:hypothetical protein